MSYMKRFLEDMADELDLDIIDQRALDEANRRLAVMNTELVLAESAQPKSGIIRHLGVPTGD